MRLVGLSKLRKYQLKKRGNDQLRKAIDTLISDIEKLGPTELIHQRSDADKVHNVGFYFFNIRHDRVMILIEWTMDGDASVVWIGDHDDYERTFKNNKKVIQKWLSEKGWI